MASGTLKVRNARAWVCLLGLVLFAAPCCLRADQGPDSDPGSVRVVKVELDDFSIAMPGTLTAGPARLIIVNVGQAEHNVEFVGPGVEERLAANIMAEEGDTLLIDFKPGEYYVYCPVGRHESYGMHMPLIVLDEGGRAPVGEAPSAAGRESVGCLQKVVRWVGRFHPPAVNFPIALLVVAALAELLLIRTGNSSFGFAGRFCLWIGALAALGAGALGWFLALEMTEATWLLTTHRWLGTATAIVAVLALVLGERAYRSQNARGRKLYLALLFLAAAMVMATGFFGGAMVFSLKHYAWP